MLKMMIVDDEKMIRDSMRDSIDWSRIGIEIMGLCKNGLEAYDMILDESPDIVLTDIFMPALSGLELIRRITQTGQDIEFIILSGYGEFSYAKEAMRYGIRHYLLKPCNEAELVGVVQEAARASYQKIANRPKHQNDIREPIFRNLIIECFSEENPDYAAILEQYERYISLSHMNYEMITLDYVEKGMRKSVAEQLKSRHQALAPSVSCYFLNIDSSILMFFEAYDYNGHKADELLNGFLEKKQKAVRQSLPSLLALLHELRHRVLEGRCIYLLQNETWIQLYSRNTAYDTAEQQKEKIPAGIKPDQLPAILTEKGAAHTGKAFIDKTIEYVRQNLSDSELSLKKIAETELFMNVGYLSRQFQKYAGCKFSAYLAKARIEEAKRIMSMNPEINVQVVAEAVGCGNNPQYFSLLFKKHTGGKAIDYIKKMRCKNGAV